MLGLYPKVIMLCHKDTQRKTCHTMDLRNKKKEYKKERISFKVHSQYCYNANNYFLLQFLINFQKND